MTTKMALDVLVVDDEKNIRATLCTCLEAFGCKVTTAATGEEAQAALRRKHYDLAFCDLRLDESSGLDLLPSLMALNPQLNVIIITAYATIETAVEAIKRGARDYLPKPFTPTQIRELLERIADRIALEREVRDLREQLVQSTPEVQFETQSEAMRSLLLVLEKAAKHDVPVLLSGENGTGKTAIARRIHQLSSRANHPFVVVNCPTLSEELLASELFGHVRGAFTGALRDKAGRVEAAAGGTLFLDEIGELTPSLQAKLLRFVQEQQFERVGDELTRQADVRIVAASNRQLESEVTAGRFRQDLFFRLNTFELAVPALRQRREDIVPLARRFVAFFGRAAPHASLELTAQTEAALTAYDWPGNVRELKNAIERAVILAPSERITPDLLPQRIVGASAKGPYLGGNFTLDEIEREHILQVLAHHEKIDDAARILGIDTSTLWRKRRRYDGA